MKISQKLVLGLLSIVLLLSTAGIFGLIASGQIIQTYEKLERQFGPEVTAANEMVANIRRAQSHFFSYLMLRSKNAKLALADWYQLTREQADALEEQLMDSQSKDWVRKIQSTLEEWNKAANRIINSYDEQTQKYGQLSLDPHREDIEKLLLLGNKIKDYSSRIIGLRTEFVKQQEAILSANLIQAHAREMEHYLSLFLMLQDPESEQRFNERYQLLQNDVATLKSTPLDADTLRTVNRMQENAENLNKLGQYLIDASKLDYSLSGVFRTSEYQRSIDEFLRNTSQLSKNASFAAQHNAELLSTNQRSEIAKAQTVRYSIVVVMLISTLTALGLCYFLTRSINNPIRALQIAAREYGKGHFDAKINLTSQDELGQLSRAFHEMAANLQETMVSKSIVTDIIESMPETLLVLDPNLTIKMVNRATYSLLGYKESDLIGKQIQELLSPQSPLYSCTPLEFSQKTSAVGKEDTYRTSQGDFIPILFSVNPLLGKDDSIQEFVCSGKDIRPIKQAENRLKNSLKKLSDVMFALDQAVILLIADDDGTVTHVNDHFCSLSKYTREELIGTKQGITDPKIHSQEFIANILDCCKKGDVWRGDIQHRAADGSSYWLHQTIVPMSSTLGMPNQLLAICADITERKRAETELLSAKQQAEDNSLAKSTFLAKMSHELRTPLNAILGYSELQQEDFIDQGLDVFAEDSKKIHAAGKHLLALINDILDLSKIEAGKMDLFVETFSISQMLEEVCSTIAPLIKSKENEFNFSCDSEIGEMTGDLIKTKQILINLLSNSSKFTSKGSITLKAQMIDQEGTEYTQFTVSDTGIGIPEDKIKSIFEAFQQADGSTTRKYGGTGLGLAITERFCSMLGGKIEVFSQEGEGSSFVVTLPKEIAPLKVSV